MCGFLGELCNDLSLSRKEAFVKLLNLSKNRGPDSQGYYSDQKNLQLGFNRLAILDQSAKGNQPVFSPSNRYIIMINGEIYNYKSLQTKYGISTDQLRSKSDTEIIAQLVDLVPVRKVVEEMNGMFACVIYDRSKKKVYLIRDFAGIKPLFYGLQQQICIFASQFDQIFLHPVFKPNLKINPEGLRDFIQLGYMQAPETIFKTVYQVRPGEMIEVEVGLKERGFNYFSLPKNIENRLFSETSKTASDEFSKCFDKVVHDQLVSDVPIGTFLSGGIDSPLVSAFAAQNKPDVTTYTVKVDHPEYNESEIARQYATKLKTNHILQTLDPRTLIDQVDIHFKAFPEPFGDPSSLLSFQITRCARESLTVMLAGDGGDELFWGYPRFLKIINQSYFFKYPLGLRKGLARMHRYFGKDISYGVSSHANIGQWQLGMHSHISKDLCARLFPGTENTAEIKTIYDYSANGNDKVELANWLRWNEYYAHMQRTLIKIDRTSMYNSLEVRVPFLDKRVIDFSWKTEPELGFSHQTPKYLLKKAMEEFFPVELINQKKMGFSFPYNIHLRKELRSQVQEMLLDSSIFGSGYFDERELKKFIKAYLDGSNNSGWSIWALLGMQHWAKNYDLK